MEQRNQIGIFFHFELVFYGVIELKSYEVEFEVILFILSWCFFVYVSIIMSNFGFNI